MKFRSSISLIFLPALASIALGGCSNYYWGKPEVEMSEVVVRTNPRGADCELVGANEYRADVETPARIKLRNDASPVKVTCTLAGYRPAHGTLVISSRGWLGQTTDAIADLGNDSLAVVGLDSGDSTSKQQPAATFDANLKPIVQTLIKQ